MNRLGIDPGLSGAVAVLGENLELLDVFDMPTMALSKGKNCVNAAGLAAILRIDQHPATAYLEDVHAMPGQGVSGMFSFGRSLGVIEGVLATLGIPVVMVPPQTWKKRAGLQGAEKDKARTMAQRLYPGADLSRKKDIGRADAILIARYGV
jgi:crossover junction endodeoxyribonuclease RuvC